MYVISIPVYQYSYDYCLCSTNQILPHSSISTLTAITKAGVLATAAAEPTYDTTMLLVLNEP